MSLATAYDSKIIAGYKLNEIQLAISKSSLSDKTHEFEKGIEFVTENHDVDPFPYPFFNKETGKVYVDARPFSKINRDGTYHCQNNLDERFNYLCAALERAWVSNDRTDASARAFGFSTEVFVRWLTNTISHKYGLDPHQKARLMALVAMFSIGQFYNNLTEDLAVQRHLQAIGRHFPLASETIQNVAAEVENVFPRDVKEFVETLAKLDLGPRLRGFNTTALYASLNGSFWGTNSQVYVALAVEYPPTMAALVMQCIENRMYKRTYIGTVVDELNRGSNHEGFKRTIALFIDQFAEE